MMKNRFLAESVGTFCLVWAGCGAIVVSQLHGVPGHLGVSLVFGLVVMAMIYAVGNVSGAHLNPAVSIAFCVARRLPARDLPYYVAAQLLGALVASLVLRLQFPGAEDLGTTRPGDGIWQAGSMEFVLSFILMFVILNVSTGHKEKGIMAGVAVGGTIALEAAMGGPISGASMNPARSIGPALASMHLQDLWLYLIFPVAGASAAVPFCGWTQGPDCCVEEDSDD